MLGIFSSFSKYKSTSSLHKNPSLSPWLFFNSRQYSVSLERLCIFRPTHTGGARVPARMGTTVLSVLATEIVIPVCAVVGIIFSLVQWFLVSRVKLTTERHGSSSSPNSNKNGFGDYLIEEEEGLNDHNVVVKCADIQNAISEGRTFELQILRFYLDLGRVFSDYFSVLNLLSLFSENIGDLISVCELRDNREKEQSASLNPYIFFPFYFTLFILKTFSTLGYGQLS